ncbi:MAG: cytochrome c4 [Xanthomonadales bacterium]|nr:cytochrome c4 [Xanthomonadales bacterium]
MRISILFSLFLLLAFNANAGESDAKAGQTKAATCVACHGADGNSMVPMWPKLAGQHTAYLERQIKLIKSGDRSVPEMTGLLGSLSDQDIADLAAWFNSNAIALGNADEKLMALGESIYRSGDANAGVAACIACHGPTGKGNPLAGYPAIAGQHATYTAKVLKDFRAGKGFSSDDAGVIMPGVAKQLSDEAITAVASYIQGLHAAE